jgi:5-oxoprolinase (ATP-hydrolysing)
MSDGWEFWIDVGGTFTDCLGRDPKGQIHTHKLLSSGVYRGTIDPGSLRHVIYSNGRASDPPHFFDGFEFHLLDHLGQAIESRQVQSFDPISSTLELDTPLSTDPTVGMIYELASTEEAPVLGVRWLLGKPLHEEVGVCTVRLGTTRGTNALLERQGAKTALVTTIGFRDVLRIAYQDRPQLFELAIRQTEQLYAEVVEVEERLDARGKVIQPLDLAKTRAQLNGLKDRGIESIAIVLLHSYRNGNHEEAIAELAATVGFGHVSISSRLSPSQRIVPRGDTTLVDAYLTPILAAYIQRIQTSLPHASLRLMTSSGSLSHAKSFRAKDLILSGPAGGVVGVGQVSKGAGFSSAIGFDMGGTSTDVCRYAGLPERRYTMELKDPRSSGTIRIVAPMLTIETVAAGGGSICGFDGQKVFVGPRSAGANPGPACYGRGGPLTVTDCNLYLGHISDEAFSIPLDRRAVARRLDEVVREIKQKTDQSLSSEELAEGFLSIANANMAAAIKRISIARGHDIRHDALISFGGAGGQHAAALARQLGIRQVIQHPYAGILSAYGIGMAEIRKFGERHIGRPLDEETLNMIDAVFDQMEAELRPQLIDEGVSPDRVTPPRRIVELRYKGQDATIAVDEPANKDFRTAFEDQHRLRYGFLFPHRPIEAVIARLELAGETNAPRSSVLPESNEVPIPIRISQAFFVGKWHDTPVFNRSDLLAGMRVIGPAIVVESLSTIVVEPGWIARMTSIGDLLLEDFSTENKSASTILLASSEPDAIQLELFNNQFTSIAEQMGVTLQKSAMSTNVKERLDFSCAIFTDSGELVVNAPHIPVHLGAMGETIRSLRADFPSMKPGEVYVTNDPFRGGSHLPDVTVVTPVFDAPGNELLFFAASRAHHAEIGGIVPGSMPPFPKSLAEEGVLIRPCRWISNESSSEDALRRLLTEAPYPTRSIDENLADLRAQAAANQTGVRLLMELMERQGIETVRAYMGHVRRAAERQMRQALLRFEPREYRFQDQLDDGSVIAVRIQIMDGAEGGSAIVDFDGTSGVAPNNLNANPAIVRAAVLYSFRCLIEQNIPLNDGVLAPITIRIPEGCLLHPTPAADPSHCPAVGGGNVETSQRVVDVILGALGVAAASQGTMNNFLFGRDASPGKAAFGYYETISGGAGAGPVFHGASGAHTHMTNTRITDPEVLEDRYPVRLRQFSIRAESGGKGKHHGGDGVVREIEFLEDAQVSLVTGRRVTRPFGLMGGAPGESGQNLLRHLSGETEELGPFVQRPIKAGEILRIETPGGGGYG